MSAATTPFPRSRPLHCSARGCRVQARWALRWNNPRLHPPQRRKTWLACEAHRGSLSDFLGTRGFLRETVPAEGLPVEGLPASKLPAEGLPAEKLAGEDASSGEAGPAT